VSRYQKGKTNLDFTEARESEWQWHQLGHMQVCTALQTDNHASTPPLSFFTGQMPFLPPNQQPQSTEGIMMPWTAKVLSVSTKLLNAQVALYAQAFTWAHNGRRHASDNCLPFSMYEIWGYFSTFSSEEN